MVQVEDKEEVSGLKNDLKQIKHIHAHTYILKEWIPMIIDIKMSSFLFKASVSDVCFSISRGGIKLRCMQSAFQHWVTEQVSEVPLGKLKTRASPGYFWHWLTGEHRTFLPRGSRLYGADKGANRWQASGNRMFSPVEMYNQEIVMTSNLSIHVCGYEFTLTSVSRSTIFLLSCKY